MASHRGRLAASYYAGVRCARSADP